MFYMYVFYHVLDLKFLEGRIRVCFSILYVSQHPVLALKTIPSGNSVKIFWLSNEGKFTTLALGSTAAISPFSGSLVSAEYFICHKKDKEKEANSGALTE